MYFLVYYVSITVLRISDCSNTITLVLLVCSFMQHVVFSLRSYLKHLHYFTITFIVVINGIKKLVPYIHNMGLSPGTVK